MSLEVRLTLGDPTAITVSGQTPAPRRLDQLHDVLSGRADLLQRVMGQQVMEELDLSHNLLTGAVPPALGQLPHLQRLDLSDNWLSSLPPELGQLDSLEELFLAENLLTTLPPTLEPFERLTILYLGYNQLSALQPLLVCSPTWNS